MWTKQESLDERIQLVHHEAFTSMLCFSRALDSSPAGTIAFVVAPSGAGKTRLSHLIGPHLYGKKFESGLRPWVRVSAQNPQAAYFTSKYLLNQILEEFRDPFNGMTHSIPSDLSPDQATRLAHALGRVATGQRATEEDKRDSVISLARAYQCRMLILDEANLMVLIKKGRPVEVYVESMRTLARAMGVRIVMLGTLKMLDFVNYSAQINRMGNIKHLDRMRDDTEKGMTEFLSFLDGVESDLALQKGLLTDYAEALYDATYGIPGELVSLLDRARIEAAMADRKHIELCDLRASLPLDAVRVQMRAEADLIEAIVNGRSINPKRIPSSAGRSGRPPRPMTGSSP